MLRSKLTSLTKVPLWLITSSVLLLASVVSLIYWYLNDAKSRARQGSFGGYQSPELKRADQSARVGCNIITDECVFETSAENIVQPEQTGNSTITWLESLNARSFPILTRAQVKKMARVSAGPLLALVIAYLAQGIFDSTRGEGALQNWAWLGSLSDANRLWLGDAGYLIAILIWVLSAPAIFLSDAVVNRSNPTNPQKPRYPPGRFFLLLASLSIYLVSIFLFITNGEDGFIRGLWVAGLVCFVVSQVPWPRIHTPSHPDAEISPRFRWQNWLVLALILVVAFWLRFNQLATIPDDFHGDMASHGSIARDYLLGVENNIFGYGFYGIPSIGFLPAALSMGVFGNNIFGLQMTSVLGGLFSLLAVYLLVWRLFNSHRLALLTTALVSINVVHIHFSRIAEYMDPWPFGCFALFFLIDGLKARRTASFGLAGVFLGLCLQMYFSGRVLVFIIGLFLVYAFFFRRAWIIQNKRGLGLMVAGVLIAIGPALVSYLTHWDSYISRAQEVFIFSPGPLSHLLNKYNTGSELGVLLTQIKLTLLMFNQSGDTSTQFGFPHPMFNSLVSPLILLGFGFALRRWKDAGMTFVLIWLGLMAVLGSILTLDAPFWPRLVGIVPAAALLAAIALDQIFELGKKTLGPHAGVLITALLALFLMVVGYTNWNQYYLAVKDNASATALVGRYIGSLPLDVTACGLLSGPPLTVRETYFLAWPHKLVDIQPDAPDSDLDTCTGPSLVWVISPENIDRLDTIRARWPDGIVQNYDFPHNDYTLTFYLVGVVPPIFLPGESSNLFAWLLYGICIVITLVLSGVMIRLFFRTLFPKIIHSQQANKRFYVHPIQVNREAPRQAGLLASLGGMFTAGYVGFNKWYDEIVAFKFPAIRPKLIVSVLLPLAAVSLAYFAQAILDQQKDDGLHLPVDWLHLSSEGQRLGIACIIFLIATLLWTFTTTGKKNNSS